MSIDLDAELWFAKKRGIDKETLTAWGVTSDGPRTVKFPYGEASKFRKGFEKDEDGGRKFWWDPPTKAGQVPFLPPNYVSPKNALLCEGETDTMALWQHIPEGLRSEYEVVGLSGLNAWKERYAEELFSGSARVFVVLDNDDPYENEDASKAGDKAWKSIRTDLGNRARRVYLPQGSKDVCEFFENYDWAAFKTLLDAASEPIRHYKRLDLDAPVPPVNWVIENMIEAGVVTVLTGDGGVGKSFLAMSMAIAIASGQEKWGGLPVCMHGPVMYVDEEQTPDLVLQRLAALGLEPEYRKNIDYLNYAGVNLHEEPWKLLEECIDSRPGVVFIDSESAVSIGAKENDNDEMTRLFVEGFRPLARESGAAVVVLHHTTKDNFGKPRGASSIRNQADQVISLIQAESNNVQSGRINVFASKPRRDTPPIQVALEGDMTRDGYVRVVVPAEVM